MGARTVDDVLDGMSPKFARMLHEEASEALRAALAALQDVDWRGADFLDIVLDDGPFSLAVVGVKGRIEGDQAFQEPTTEVRPLLAHPVMEKIIAATESALAAADDDCREQIASDVWFGVVMQVSAWLSSNWNGTSSRPALPALLSLKDHPPGGPICDLTMLGSWSRRFDFIASHVRSTA